MDIEDRLINRPDIADLKAQLEQATQERDAAINESVELDREHELAQERIRELGAACAEKDAAIHDVLDPDDNCHCGWCKRARHALSTDAGSGWISPEQAKALRRPLEMIRDWRTLGRKEWEVKYGVLRDDFPSVMDAEIDKALGATNG